MTSRSSITILGQITDPGKPDRANEDGAGAAGPFAWIIDGATGLTDTPLLNAPSDAAWLTAVLSEAFRTHADVAADAAALLREGAALAERRFRAERNRAPEERYEIPTAAVLIARADEDGLEIVDLGDCSIYVADAGSITRYGGTERGRALEKDNADKLMAGGQGRTADVLAHLRAIRNRANTPGGYPIIAPDRNSAAPARRNRHRAREGEALFLTDGFEAAIDDYALYDPSTLMDAARRDLSVPLAALRDVEATDPDMTRFPRFKPSDDATALLVRFGAASPGA